MFPQKWIVKEDNIYAMLKIWLLCLKSDFATLKSSEGLAAVTANKVAGLAVSSVAETVQGGENLHGTRNSKILPLIRFKGFYDIPY